MLIIRAPEGRDQQGKEELGVAIRNIQLYVYSNSETTR